MICISVVPGGTGAWRRQCVLTVGGFSQQTLTEDADLTMMMLVGGARIVSELSGEGRAAGMWT